MKTIAYLRVSTDAQDYASQRNQIDTWATARGHPIDEYIGDTASGATPWQERELRNIIDRLARGDAIVVSEVSRIARSTIGVLTFVELAVARGVSIYACRNAMEFGAGIQSKVTLTVLALAAEIERDLIRDRTRAALKAKRERGEHLGRKVGQVVALKLDSRREEILRCLAAKVSKRAIARMLTVSPTTLHHWLSRERDKIAEDLPNQLPLN